MPVSPPQWLNAPVERWLPCKVLSELSPQGYVVELSIEGQDRSIVVPYGAVKITENAKLPTDGELRVFVIADLPEDKRLAELPSTPMNGSQRMKLSAGALRVS